MIETLQCGDLIIDEQSRPSIVMHISPRFRLECKEGSSNKFYELWIRGTTVYKRYGRIGSTGKMTEEKCENELKAKKHFDAMMKSKLNGGYKEVGKENTYFLNAPWRKPVSFSLSHSDLLFKIKSNEWKVQSRK